MKLKKINDQKAIIERMAKAIIGIIDWYDDIYMADDPSDKEVEALAFNMNNLKRILKDYKNIKIKV
jgi:hypothetical protein